MNLKDKINNYDDAMKSLESAIEVIQIFVYREEAHAFKEGLEESYEHKKAKHLFQVPLLLHDEKNQRR